MAYSRPKPEISSEKLSNDFLTCPLCFDLFKSPKVLHCQHTFCLTCLRHYVATRGFSCTIPCPLCKDVTAIPGNDVVQLKNNYTIVNLLQCVEESWKIASEEKPATPKSSSVDDCLAVCGACNETKDPIRYCETCSFWLCTTCTTSHSRVLATSHHKLQTNQEVDVTCKTMATQGELTIQAMKQFNDDKTELFLGQIEQLPGLMDAVRLKIETAGDNACHLIREKQNELMRQITSFQHDQQDSFSRKLQLLEFQNTEFSRISGVLCNIKTSTDGFQNHTKAKVIERDLKSMSPIKDFPADINDFETLSFVPYRTEQSMLQHINLGSLRIVKGCPGERKCLQDHMLQIHKVATLEEREYISGLAVNKFAEKYVVANNESVFAFKPNCRQPRRFVPFQRHGNFKKPWGVAYCESRKKIYITVAGEQEGEGAVYVYTPDGTEHSVLASGLTLPRGISLHRSLIYVCDQIDRCVYIFSSEGSIIKVLKKLPDGNFYFIEPMFISVGAEGRIAVSDGYQSVKIFNSQFTHIFTYTPNFLDAELWGVLVLHNGTTIVCDWKHGLHKISRDFQSNNLIAIEGNLLQEPSALSSIEHSNIIYVGNGSGEICSAI